MKKQLLCLLLLTVCVLSCSCSKTSVSTSEIPKTTVESVITESVTDTGIGDDGEKFGKMSVRKTNDSILTVEFINKEYANQQISVLVLKDSKFIDSWKDNSDAVINIGQISLDANGEGTIKLYVETELESVTVYVCAQDGKNIYEVVANSENG